MGSINSRKFALPTMWEASTAKRLRFRQRGKHHQPKDYASDNVVSIISQKIALPTIWEAPSVKRLDYKISMISLSDRTSKLMGSVGWKVSG